MLSPAMDYVIPLTVGIDENGSADDQTYFNSEASHEHYWKKSARFFW